MGQDYHIYISSKTAESVSQKTVPFANRNEDDVNGSESIAPFVSPSSLSQAKNVAVNPVGAGIAALSKVLPPVAIAVATIKLTDHIVGITAQNVENYTGDYRFNLAYDNVKNSIGVALNPIGYLKYNIERQLQYNKLNKQIEQNRLLVGDATLRNLTKGV